MLKMRGAVLAFAIFAAEAACNERPLTTYADRGQAERDGAFNRGWLPAFLPASASAIQEVHDLDSNERWGRFSFRADDVGWVQRDLAPLLDASGLSVRPPHALKTWPGVLSGTLDHTRLQGAGMTAYTSRQDAHPTSGRHLIVVVDRRTSICYFWSQL